MKNFRIVILILATVVLHGCVKEILVLPPVPSTEKVEIEFLRAEDLELAVSDELVTLSLPLTPDIDTITVGYVRISDRNVKKPFINILLKVDSTFIPSGYVSLTSSDYSFTPRVATDSIAPVRIIVNKSNLGFGNNKALGITADTTAENVKVRREGNGLLVSFNLNNKWDGVYSIKGTVLKSDDISKTGAIPEEEMGLATKEGNTVSFEDNHVWADGTPIGIGVPVLSIDETTNKVTITSSGGAFNNPNYNSHYDPLTRTFYISFSWGNGPLERLATDTLTYLRAR